VSRKQYIWKYPPLNNFFGGGGRKSTKERFLLSVKVYFFAWYVAVNVSVINVIKSECFKSGYGPNEVGNKSVIRAFMEFIATVSVQFSVLQTTPHAVIHLSNSSVHMNSMQALDVFRLSSRVDNSAEDPLTLRSHSVFNYTRCTIAHRMEQRDEPISEVPAILHIVTCISIARQRLGKRVPAVNTPPQ
jgi:hypothetical protein